MTQNPVYAYAIRKKDGTLAVLHELDKDSKFKSKYRVPVSREKERILMYGSFFSPGGLEHSLIDVSSLVETGVLTGDSIYDLDMQTPVEYQRHIKQSLEMR